MKKRVVALLLLSVACSAFAAVSAPFDESGAAQVVRSGECVKAAAELLQTAKDAYSAKDLPKAGANMAAATFLELVAKSKSKPNAEMLTFVLANQSVLETAAKSIRFDDNLPRVFEILDEIWRSDSGAFKKYTNLALALAIVFDTPPPANWPHSQVSEKILPRKFPPAADAFKMWIEDRQKGRLLSALEKMSVEELRFLVATVATAEDREYAQRSVSANAANLGKIYSTISYDHSRLNSKRFDWETAPYSLREIKKRGGICTDQSYYTAETAKAKGLPAFIFSGAGGDGFHAWVAYMQKSGKWDFSVGRFASGNFVTGTTIDPQTWREATDHSLQSMRENFRRNPKYKTSEIHADFAGIFFAEEDFKAARAAAAQSVKSDGRNFQAWQLLYLIAEKTEGSPEKVCAEAMKAFARYPDSDAYFRRLLIKRLAAAGKKAEMKKTANAFVLKNKTARPDLAMEFARVGLLSDIEDNDVKKLKSSYKKLFGLFKGSMAMTLDGIVIPVLETLLREGKTDKANEVVELTRQMIKASKDETIESNFERVFANVKRIAEKQQK